MKPLIDIGRAKADLDAAVNVLQHQGGGGVTAFVEVIECAMAVYQLQATEERDLVRRSEINVAFRQLQVLRDAAIKDGRNAVIL